LMERVEAAGADLSFSLKFTKARERTPDNRADFEPVTMSLREDQCMSVEVMCALCVEGVDDDVVEAARGMGMTGLQILRRVELPLAIPLLFTGIRVAAVTVVATAPIAAIAGGGGLGDIIVNQASYRLSGVIGASICVMGLSAGVFVALLGIQISVTPRPLRRTTVIGNVPRKES